MNNVNVKFLWIALLMTLAANATKPTIPDVDSKVRESILSLRYAPSASETANKRNFLKNLQRDCNGFAYSGKDLDLSSEAIIESYPLEYVQKILVQEALHLCPRSVVLIFTKFSIPLKIRKDIARTYVTKYQGDQYWPYTSLSEMQILFHILGTACTSKDIAAFDFLFCRYSQQIGTEAGWRDVYLKSFHDKCKKFVQSSLSCKPKP